MSRFALLGHPLGHSLSPVIHQAAYDALDLEHGIARDDAQKLGLGSVDLARRDALRGPPGTRVALFQRIVEGVFHDRRIGQELRRDRRLFDGHRHVIGDA